MPITNVPITNPNRLLETPHTPRMDCAGHLIYALSGAVDEFVPKVLELLRGYHFDAIACQGLSGLLVAPLIARELKKTLLVVRKPGEDCHSIRTVEGDYAARRYVILDDFISSGATSQRIVDAVSEAMPDAHCVGVCEYLYPGKSLVQAPHKTPNLVKTKP